MSRTVVLWKLKTLALKQAKKNLREMKKYNKLGDLISRHGSANGWNSWPLALNTGILLEAEASRIFIKNFYAHPKVYYFGIGNPAECSIDIIWPLLTCDFSELIACDIKPINQKSVSPDEIYQRFIRAVTLNLSLLDGIKQGEISFKKLEENTFQTSFVFNEQKRDVKVRYSFNAISTFPEELQGGYEVLFSRRTGVLFWKIQDEVLVNLKTKLRKYGMFILMHFASGRSRISDEHCAGRRIGSDFVNLTIPDELLNYHDTGYTEEKLYSFLKYANS